MRSVVFVGVVIMALGAGSVFSMVSARPGSRTTGKRDSAPRAISGGSKAGPNGAISGGRNQADSAGFENQASPENQAAAPRNSQAF